MKFQSESKDDRNYVKLKSGESVVGVLRGEPFEFRIHWTDSKSSVCPGDGCAICPIKKSSFRFRVNFITKESSKENPHEFAYVAKVLEMGWNFYDDLRALNEEYDPIENYAIKITRQGEKLSTKYSILPVSNGLITPEKEKEISKVALNNLGHLTEQEQAPHPSTQQEEYPEIPF
jgi:hypothetical protein